MANITTLLFEGEMPGGLLTQSLSVRNWPGEIESPGAAITEKLRAQAIKRGVQIEREKVVGIDVSSWPYTVTAARIDDPTQMRTVKALSLVVGMGASSNYLGIPGEKEYWSKGVTNCAVCEGSLYRGKVVCIVGGGDSAMEEASYLSGIAKKVYVFVRKDKLRAVDNRKDEVLARDNVEVVYNTQLHEVRGDKDKVTSVLLHNNKDKSDKEMPMDGVFLAIGFTPNTELFKDKLELTSGGYIKLHDDQETSCPGVYALGDIVDPVYKQAVTASGDGCRAALQAQRFLGDLGYDVQKMKLPAEATAEQAAKPRVADKKDDSAEEATKEEQPTAEAVQQEAKDATEEKSQDEAQPAVEEKKNDGAEDATEFPPAGKAYEISSMEEFNRLTKQTKKPVVVDYHATWCMPCKMMAPLFNKLARKYDDKVLFVKVNIDKLSTAASTNNIRGVPTFTFLKEGKELHRIVGGGASQGQFTTHIDEMIKE
jgi:thioredoxin reductase (NADPH)